MNKIIALLGIMLVISGFGFALVSAHGDEDVNNPDHHNGMMSGFLGFGFGFMWMFGWLFMILIVVALILLIVWLIKQLQNPVRRKRR